MPRKRFALLTIVVVVVACAAWLFVQSRGSLDDFVGRDLRKLSDVPDGGFFEFASRYLPKEIVSERARFDRVLTRTLPKELLPKENLFGDFEAWYLWRLRDVDENRLVLCLGRRLFAIPGGSRVRIAFLDTGGTYIQHVDFSTGSRMQIEDAALSDAGTIDTPVITIHSSPSLHGGSVHRQYYAVDGDTVVLVRLEDDRGALVANHYWPPNFGPKPPARTANDWEALLSSGKSAELLEALTWLGGYHYQYTENATQSGWLSQEQAEIARLVGTLRARPSVRQRIEELEQSSNAWVREAARLANEPRHVINGRR